MKCVGAIFNRPQAARQAAGILFCEFIKHRLAQPEVKSTAAHIIEIEARKIIFCQSASLDFGAAIKLTADAAGGR
jgi:hypothetical protein